MRRDPCKIWLRCVLVAGLAGCQLPPPGSSRDRLIGLPGPELTRCMGPPVDQEFAEDGETERVLYLFYEVPQDDSAGETRARSGVRIDPETGRPPFGVGFCQIVFELRGGRVQSFEAEGKLRNGLSDPGCVDVKTRRCGAKPRPARR